MDIISFVIFSLLLIAVSLYCVRKHHHLLQPHSIYSAYIFTLLLLIPAVQFYGSDLFPDKTAIVYTNFMIGLSYLFFSLGFLFKSHNDTLLFHCVVKKLNVQRIPRVVLSVHVFILIALALAVLAYLAHASGLGVRSWFFNPRIGYQFYRRGFGHFYVVSMGLLNIAYLYTLFFSVKTIKRLTWVTLLFAAMLYFYGCKGALIFGLFEAIVFYNFFIRKIRFKQAFLMFVGLSFVFSILFIAYRPRNSNTDSISREFLAYASYYNEGRKFFADFNDHFHYVYGQEYLSGLWAYVPRALYPDKPYSYGLVRYVVEYYYPNAGPSGNTPSFGGPVREYLNFGIPGVILIAFLQGYWASLCYRYFIHYRTFIGFVILSGCMGFSVFPIMQWPFYSVLWYLIHIFLLLFHKQIMQNAAKSENEWNKESSAPVMFSEESGKTLCL